MSNTVFAEIINIGNEKLKYLLNQGIPIVDVRNKNEWEKSGVIYKSHLVSMLDNNGKYSIVNWYNKFSKIKLKSSENTFFENNRIQIKRNFFIILRYPIKVKHSI